MKSLKTVFLIALCGAILTGVWTLKDNLIVGAANPTEAAADGGAAQYIGKQDIPDSPYFAHPDIYNMQPNEHLLLLTKFKTMQQSTEYTCGPVAANMVVNYFLGKPLHTEMQIAEIMDTSSLVGTNTKGMCRYFKEIGWQVKSSGDTTSPKNYEAFLQFVKSNLSEGTPVIVENVDWGGHWRIIIGYDTMGTEYAGDDVLLMADPYDLADHLQDGYNIVPAEKFFYMWFDAQLFDKSDQKRQWLTAKPAKNSK